MSFSQSVEFPLTQKDTCTLSGQLQTSNGTGKKSIHSLSAEQRTCHFIARFSSLITRIVYF